MDPISIIIEIEVATLLLAGVGAAATWLHHKNQASVHRQRERHYQEMKSLHERHHTELMRVTNRATKEK